MILVCPLCQTRYLLPATHFVDGPRQVRCARCLHKWLASPPKEIDVVGSSSLPTRDSPRPAPTPLAEGANLPVVRRDGIGILRLVLGRVGLGVLGIIFLWLILDRKDISEGWPSMVPIYDIIGLHIYYPGEGLNLENVRSELNYEDGITKLVVEGSVHNTTKKSQKIPDIMASAIGPDGDVMQSWQIEAPAATLSSEETIPFRSAINTPKGTVVNVNLNFIEPKNAE